MIKKIFLIILLFALFLYAQDEALPGTTPPGVIVSHSPIKSKKFIGSPSLVILPNGDFLASHDYFGPGISIAETFIYKSTDKGLTWRLISNIKNQFWSNLFYHNGSLYIMGTTKEYGYVVIRKSIDGGVTWTTPTDKKNGLILDDGEYHTAPVPMVIHDGRIWRSMEDRNPPTDWGKYFRAFVMSVPVNADLLDAANWEATNRLSYDQSWPGSAWLEGNVVITPHDYLWCILRNHTTEGNRAAVMKVGLTGRVVTFDPETGFINFPGGSVKFTIRYDELTKRYISLTNYIPQRFSQNNPERTRNTLALISSDNLVDWPVNKIILEDPSVSNVGFQYVDFQFDGDDIVFLSRTSYFEKDGSASSQHDANYLTFHRIENFRLLLAK
ncbi:MAG: glycoside hydrolase [Melioribacteraceae bacterium]|nr:glycoside hydrolase [Melioribacteraceae bacterium]